MTAKSGCLKAARWRFRRSEIISDPQELVNTASVMDRGQGPVWQGKQGQSRGERIIAGAFLRNRPLLGWKSQE